MRHLLPILLLCTFTTLAPACDGEDSEHRDEDIMLESSSSSDSDSSGDIEDIVMPDNQQPFNPQVGDIVSAEELPDRSVYLFDAAIEPYVFMLLRVGDLEFTELDTPEFAAWRAGKCAEYCAEHPNANPAIVLCEYTFSVP
jgi:hypothetical protein